jgi:hypothetical protein
VKTAMSAPFEPGFERGALKFGQIQGGRRHTRF